MSRVLDIVCKCIPAAGLVLAMIASSGAWATTFKVLHSFTGAGGDGCYPVTGLIRDGAGSLYGTTGGGTCGYGTIFELAPNGTETVLYAFTGGKNGQGPSGTLIMDQQGNLYGVAYFGGGAGCGVVFELRSDKTEKTIHTFHGPPGDGCTPEAGLIMDIAGNFYSTTAGGGKRGAGTVFELAPDGVEKIIHSFNLRRSGDSPDAGLLRDKSGNLYGTAVDGGAKDFGTAFAIAPDGTETVLHAFRGPPNDGNYPLGGLIADGAGILYGTVFGGDLPGCYSNSGCGAVFKLTTAGTETIVHSFTGKNGDGANPAAGLITDSNGNLFGTTNYGGGSCTLDVYGCGTVFKIAADGTETIFYSFGEKNGANGAFPVAGLVADNSANLYGTASGGGAYGYGTVFEITP